jgi:hypothetical protein
MREKISSQQNNFEKKIEEEKIEEEKILDSKKKSSLLENTDNNIKIKLSFPHNAVNI